MRKRQRTRKSSDLTRLYLAVRNLDGSVTRKKKPTTKKPKKAQADPAANTVQPEAPLANGLAVPESVGAPPLTANDLPAIAERLRDALDRKKAIESSIEACRVLWVDNQVEIITLLTQARNLFPANQQFNAWLTPKHYHRNCTDQHQQTNPAA